MVIDWIRHITDWAMYIITYFWPSILLGIAILVVLYISVFRNLRTYERN